MTSLEPHVAKRVFDGLSALDDVVLANLKAWGKLDVLAKLAKHIPDFGRTAKKYASEVARLKPNSNQIIDTFDSLADVEGAARWLKDGNKLDDVGILFEIETAAARKNAGDLPTKVQVNYTKNGDLLTDIDVVTAGMAICVKAEDFRGVPVNRIPKASGDLYAELRKYIDYANENGLQAVFRSKHPLPEWVTKVIHPLIQSGALQIIP